MAMEHSAMTTARNAPSACRFIRVASHQASGISSTQKPKKFTMVGVTVSPAPLKAYSNTITQA
jgi:hypothetical protein